MLSYFFWGMVILLVATAIFYIVFLSFIYYWRETRVNVVVVPLLFTFEFFITGFLLVSVIGILLQYLPDIIDLITAVGPSHF